MLKNTTNQKISLISFYNRPNKYSFNALFGALERTDFFDRIDFHIERKPDQLISKISQLDDDILKVVAVSFATPQLWDTIDIIDQIHGLSKENLLIIAGGPHPTGAPEDTLSIGVDVVIIGEGEESFPELIKILLNNTSIDCDLLSSIKGIACLDNNNRIKKSRRKNRVNLDDYSPFSDKLKIYGPIEITRGCPFVCAFCQTPTLFGAQVRHRSIERICYYVNLMKKKGLNDVRVITPNALAYGSIDGKQVNLGAVNDLLSSIKNIIGNKGRIFFGSFPSEVRPEHVSVEALDILKRYISNDNLIIGAQTGSQRMLDICHRGHSFQDVYKAVELTLNASFKANVDFIFGLPGETQKDVNFTLKMMDDLTKMGAKVHTHTFMPLPQTKFARAEPGVVPESVKKRINQLSSQGLAYGDWKKQEKFAKKISNHLTKQYVSRKF